MEKEVFLCQSLTGTGDCCFFHRQCSRQVAELRLERRRDLVRRSLQASATAALLFTAVLTWVFVVQLPDNASAGRDSNYRTAHRKTLWSFSRPDYLVPQDVFVSVKTSRKFHRTRLDVITKTWFQLAPSHTWFFTDAYDPDLDRKTGGHLVVTDCPSTHSRQALCCKMAAEFDAFLDSGKKWFCHFDDDNYVNVPALVTKLSRYDFRHSHYLGKPSLAHPLRIPSPSSDSSSGDVTFSFATGGAGFCLSRAAAAGKMMQVAGGGRFEDVADKIRLPDDVTMGYVAEVLSGTPLEVVDEFHSHLETQALLDPASIKDQISFSYASNNAAADEPNVLAIKGKFDEIQDPTRFLSLHCKLFPYFGFCQAP